MEDLAVQVQDDDPTYEDERKGQKEYIKRIAKEEQEAKDAAEK
jgi:hypothetical protein